MAITAPIGESVTDATEGADDFAEDVVASVPPQATIITKRPAVTMMVPLNSARESQRRCRCI
jgi:hypothetical protein